VAPVRLTLHRAAVAALKLTHVGSGPLAGAVRRQGCSRSDRGCCRAMHRKAAPRWRSPKWASRRPGRLVVISDHHQRPIRPVGPGPGGSPPPLRWCSCCMRRSHGPISDGRGLRLASHLMLLHCPAEGGDSPCAWPTHQTSEPWLTGVSATWRLGNPPEPSLAKWVTMGGVRAHRMDGLAAMATQKHPPPYGEWALVSSAWAAGMEQQLAI